VHLLEELAGAAGGVTFLSDIQSEALWTKDDLLAVATVPGQALTFTAVPPGTGFRIAIKSLGPSGGTSAWGKRAFVFTIPSPLQPSPQR
jgi:hypothetical protein